MAWHSRFGKAFGELGSHLKATPFIATGKDMGVWAGAKHLALDTLMPYVNQAERYAADYAAAAPEASQRTLLAKSFGRVIGQQAAIAGGGAAAGYGYGLYRRHKGESVSRARMFGYMALGGNLAAKAGTARMFHRYGGPGNSFNHLAASPLALMRGFRGA